MRLAFYIDFDRPITLGDQTTEAIGLFDTADDCEAWFKKNHDLLSQYDRPNDPIQCFVSSMLVKE